MMPLAVTYGGWVAAAALLIAILLSWRNRSGHLHRDEQLVLSRARQKASHILTSARDQAMDILANSKISATDDKSKLEEEINKISAEQLREFSNTMATISKSMEVDALKEVDGFKKAMEMETIQSQKVVAEAIQAKYSETEVEIKEYRAKMLLEVDKEINTIVASVVKEVTGKVITINEHEELILAALNEAKTKNAI